MLDSEHIFDGVNDQLRVTVSTSSGTLEDFVAAGSINVSLVPAFYRVNTNGLEDRIPDVANIQILFDATDADSSGNPNPDQAFGFTSEIDDLNAKNWEFVRFRVLFNLNTDPMAELDLSTPRPALEHLRIQLDY